MAVKGEGVLEGLLCLTGTSSDLHPFKNTQNPRVEAFWEGRVYHPTRQRGLSEGAGVILASPDASIKRADSLASKRSSASPFTGTRPISRNRGAARGLTLGRIL